MIAKDTVSSYRQQRSNQTARMYGFESSLDSNVRRYVSHVAAVSASIFSYCIMFFYM